jgi:hypothetical protein
MHTINIKHMDKYPEYFGEAKEICEEFGLLPLMEFSHDYDGDLIAQFFAIIHLKKTNDHEVTWMTRDKLMRGTCAQFIECLGYLVVQTPEEHGLDTSSTYL